MVDKLRKRVIFQIGRIQMFITHDDWRNNGGQIRWSWWIEQRVHHFSCHLDFYICCLLWSQYECKTTCSVNNEIVELMAEEEMSVIFCEHYGEENPGTDHCRCIDSMGFCWCIFRLLTKSSTILISEIHHWPVPGATPISKAPYRMVPKELQELKIQI